MTDFWVGTYTADMGGSADGILHLTTPDDGASFSVTLAAHADSPSYLVRSADAVYAVGEGSATLASFERVEHGVELRETSRVPAAGPAPCHLHLINNALISSSYGDGAVGVNSIAADGTLITPGQRLPASGFGPKPEQDSAHAHCALAVDDRIVLTADLGADVIRVHSSDDGVLTRMSDVALPAGCGPRDLALHPSGRVIVLAELSCEIFVLDRVGDTFTVAEHLPLAGRESGDQASGIVWDDNGRFAWSGLRGSNRIAVTEFDAQARLGAVGFVDCGGRWPRHLAFAGGRLYVANQRSNSVTVHDVGGDGMPHMFASLPVPSPTCLLLAD